MKKVLFTSVCISLLTVNLQASFFENMIDKVSDKITQKTENVLTEKSDKMIDNAVNTMNEENKSTKKVTNLNKVAELKELVQMKKEGYITDAEFRQQKALILNK
ncbi:SHOCT domain-containing protein [Halarcobacter anaerophilus]|uniref:SHOCT domain-containing protein n=1 Tax=Halarcobacter anaerophilus TaxID=877500 RepID=A0A4Q0XZV0_9BACT|nr:SHOCT domain-containing protein [Halarcobacter anaerophilus]QDF28516.1 hypothetical protein AANAER_1030 [Halarcobacter anaerophilus]RXJ63246.1 hypothetical protein CRV06_06085 [Halarcobacter anaerophilus]